MKTVVREMRELERQSGMLNVWLCHGFPYADVPTIGAQAVAITKGDPSLAAQLAQRLGRRFLSLRDRLRRTFQTIDASLTRALQAERGPVTIADTADNPGGGALGDSTFFLRKMIEREIEDAALGPLYDPEAVSICHDAGHGSKFQLANRGEIGLKLWRPVDAACTVIGLADEVTQNFAVCDLRWGPAQP